MPMFAHRQNCPFPEGDPDPHVTHGYVGQFEPNGISIGSAGFAVIITLRTHRHTDHATPSVAICRIRLIVISTVSRVAHFDYSIHPFAKTSQRVRWSTLDIWYWASIIIRLRWMSDVLIMSDSN